MLTLKHRYIMVKAKEILNEKDELENYFSLN
jgi:hypothetical protein